MGIGKVGTCTTGLTSTITLHKPLTLTTSTGLLTIPLEGLMCDDFVGIEG